MCNHQYTASLRLVSTVAVLCLVLPSVRAFAQCSAHGGTGGHNHAAEDDRHAGHADHQNHLPEGGVPPLLLRTPHGGLFLEAGKYRLEVVYLPQQIRVYLFGESMEPLSTQALRGEMSPLVRGESSPRLFSLQYVPPCGSADQDYLMAAANMSQLPDQTPIRFHFENIPDRQHPISTFTPVFYRSGIRSYVTQVSFVQADQVGLARQQVCPITGAALGSMGKPVKVLIGDRPLYLCCAGCVERVRNTAGFVSTEPISGVSN